MLANLMARVLKCKHAPTSTYLHSRTYLIIFSRWKDGQKYYGDYFKGDKHGKGEFAYPDGSKYEGEIKANKLHGTGT